MIYSCVSKTLNNTSVNTAAKNVKDIQFFGQEDAFRLISKASSKREGWMKSTKAMNVPGGVLVQVSTQQGDHVVEALCFVAEARVVKVGEDVEGYRLRPGALVS